MTLRWGSSTLNFMTATSITKGQQFSFAIAGVIFGVVLGFVAAHQYYGGRYGGVVQATAPETMGGQRGPMSAAAPPSGGGQPSGAQSGGQPGDAPSMEMMQKITEELTSLKKALEQDPKNVMVLTRLGNIYMDAGMHDRALNYYASALESEPDNVDVRTDMGTCLRQMGKTAEALRAFEESLARDPKHWKTWFNIGVVNLYDLGDYDKALSAFTKVHDLNPAGFDMNAVRAEIDRLKSEKSGKTSGAPS